MIRQIDEIVSGQSNPVSWLVYFASLSLLVSSRSPCERLHVGCVLIDSNNRILSTGYNGFLRRAKHESIVRDNHEQAIVHAEQNAVSHAAKSGISLEKSTAYITHYPCVNCFKILIAAGVTRIYYLKDYKNDEVVAKLSEEVVVPCIKLDGVWNL